MKSPVSCTNYHLRPAVTELSSIRSMCIQEPFPSNRANVSAWVRRTSDWRLNSGGLPTSPWQPAWPFSRATSTQTNETIKIQTDATTRDKARALSWRLHCTKRSYWSAHLPLSRAQDNAGTDTKTGQDLVYRKGLELGVGVGCGGSLPWRGRGRILALFCAILLLPLLAWYKFL